MSHFQWFLLILWSFVGILTLVGQMDSKNTNKLSDAQSIFLIVACGPVAWFIGLIAADIWALDKFWTMLGKIEFKKK